MLSFDNLYQDTDLPSFDGGRLLDIRQLIIDNFDWAMAERPIGVSYFTWGWAVEAYTWTSGSLEETQGAPREFNIGRIVTGMVDTRTTLRYYWCEKTPWIWLRQATRVPLQAVMVNQFKRTSFFAYPENWPYAGASLQNTVVPASPRRSVLGIFAKKGVRYRVSVSIAFNERDTQAPPSDYVYF